MNGAYRVQYLHEKVVNLFLTGSKAESWSTIFSFWNSTNLSKKWSTPIKIGETSWKITQSLFLYCKVKFHLDLVIFLEFQQFESFQNGKGKCRNGSKRM